MYVICSPVSAAPRQWLILTEDRGTALHQAPVQRPFVDSFVPSSHPPCQEGALQSLARVRVGFEGGTPGR